MPFISAISQQQTRTSVESNHNTEQFRPTANRATQKTPTMAPKDDFPPVRACLFDMDGTLLNTEDLYTDAYNILLASHNAPNMTWEVKQHLMGRPAAQSLKMLMDYSGITHVPIAEVDDALKKIQYDIFPSCKPLPGVEKLLKDLSAAQNDKGQKLHIALATSARQSSYEVKTRNHAELMSIFREGRRVTGDDPRIGRGKPSPDIYLLALKCINDTLEGEEAIKPEECLVFEDGLLGVESGRRAGMRVVWIPHESLVKLYGGKEKEVLAGRGAGSIIDAHELGEADDGWGEQLVTLEDFPYQRYGIVRTGSF